jgi:hypothetical protein
MNLPGFTAEASLYKSSGHYHGSTGRGERSSAAGVMPQACKPEQSLCECLWSRECCNPGQACNCPLGFAHCSNL